MRAQRLRDMMLSMSGAGFLSTCNHGSLTNMTVCAPDTFVWNCSSEKRSPWEQSLETHWNDTAKTSTNDGSFFSTCILPCLEHLQTLQDAVDLNAYNKQYVSSVEQWWHT
jgi:hypothetical protein|eukprot:COSAG06_NODE_4547_length_4157_cov_2.064564_3_plen_110_part_00